MSTIKALTAVIEARKLDPPAGSYTAFLFEKGENEVLKKLGEEAIEVIIAAKGEGDDRVIYEMADWIYHALVLLSLRGQRWEDVELELARRFR